LLGPADVGLDVMEHKVIGKGRFRFRSRLFLKFIIPYTFLIVTVLSLGGWLFYTSAKKGLEAELSHRLVGVANMVVNAVNPSFLLRIQPGDENTSLYKLLLKKLLKIEQATEINAIHIFDQEQKIILDLDQSKRIGEEDLLLQIDALELEDVWKGLPKSSLLYLGADGRYYKTGYSPLRDKKGRVIAIVGVEVGADFMETLNEVKGQAFWITALSTVLIILVSFVLSRSMIQPIQLLVTATEQLGEEGLYPKVSLNRRDELGDLGNHFNHMIEQIRTKDALLKEMYQREKSRAEELEGYSQTLLKSIPSGVIGVDLSGNITSCNRAAERILDRQAEVLLDKNYTEALGPFKELGDFIRITLEGGEKISRKEFSIEGPGQDRRWIGVVTSAIEDVTGKQIGVTAVFSDLTEVRRLQEEIKLKEQLAALGELSAGVAHEIRNPLAVIQALVELLSRKAQSKEEKEIAGEVVSEVEHLNRFVTDFLRFSRMPKLYIEECDIHELVENAISFSVPPGKYERLMIETELPEDLPPLFVDPFEFRRVLLNAILNAIQAMQGEGRLLIRAFTEGDQFILQLSDTGPGISAENLEEIFRPFFTTKPGGTGLGMAISHRVITGHGGKIYFKNNSDKGTSLFIEVPLKRAEAPDTNGE